MFFVSFYFFTLKTGIINNIYRVDGLHIIMYSTRHPINGWVVTGHFNDYNSNNKKKKKW